YDALVGSISHSDLVTGLEKLYWQPDDYFKPDFNWLASLPDDVVDQWVVILPQHKEQGARSKILGRGPFSVHRRQRRRGSLFGAISDPKHRHSAQRIAGAVGPTNDAAAESLHGPRTGALLVYPVVEIPKGAIPDDLKPEEVVMAFVAVAPMNARPVDGRLVAFVVRDPTHAEDAIVDILDE